MAIGYHSRDFAQASEEEVVATLREPRGPRVSTGTSA
jgi:predicted phosphoribosyltransferase